MAEYQPQVYGSQHKKQREALMFQLRDGDECEYCARPMFRDADKNFDGASLEADHLDADTSRLAGRLLHRSCNRAIVSKWVQHGPGWFDKYGFDPEVLHVRGGSVVVW